MDYLAISLFASILTAVSTIAGLMVGRTRGRERVGSLLGFWLGPLGLLIVLLLPLPRPVETTTRRGSLGDFERG